MATIEPVLSKSSIPKSVPGVAPKGKFGSAIEFVRSTHTDELVIVLCGPVGTPLHWVADKFKSELESKFDYDCDIIKLTPFIEKYEGEVQMTAKRFERIKDLITKGNALRKKYGNAVLAELAISKISLGRTEQKITAGATKFETRRKCHIIDSVKNQAELDVLRLVYRDMLYCIGVLSPLAYREKKLQSESMDGPQIWELIDQDSGEEISHGQRVGDTFPQSDFFLRVDSDVDEITVQKIHRFLSIILGTEVITPTKDETAMYMAASAATNSACLSRQVGACVTDAAGNVLATGWNDVPAFGGNLYSSSNPPASDFRCKNLGGGVCFNDREKHTITLSLADDLAKAELVKDTDRAKVVEVIAKSKIRDLIEFSRSIHAEMHAILIGSQTTGDRMIGGKIFVTTYPCHSCARHIIAAGISKVYYIEPYRKSLATRLHQDAISESESEPNHVNILAFDGVAPNKYMDLFKMRKDSRKKDGKKIAVQPRDASQKAEVTLEALPVLEAAVVQTLVDKQLIEVAGYEKQEKAI
jgi:deoxycytidylate deaminase